VLQTAHGVALFTDGSHGKGNAGAWAWIAIDAFDGEESDSGFVSDTTNNRMEMEAWVHGLTALYDKYGACIVLVYCDSHVVGKGYSGEFNRKSNLDIWEKLFAAAEKHEYVEWEYVKGHSDSQYNNKVDALAVKTRKSMST